MAVARVLAMIVSNPDGCRFEVTRDGPAFVGGVDDAVERLGGGLSGGEHPDVIDDDQFGAGDPGDGPGNGAVHAGAADVSGQGLQGEPGDPHPSVDDFVGEGFDEVCLAGARGSGDGQVLGAADPFQAQLPQMMGTCGWV